jgi:hypothetical protein
MKRALPNDLVGSFGSGRDDQEHQPERDEEEKTRKDVELELHEALLSELAMATE